MKTPSELCRAARELGLRIQVSGSDLLVKPANRCPPEFAAELKRSKAELLGWLEAEKANLPADCAPWLHIARQILAGEFYSVDHSLAGSLAIGLRHIKHPLCERALAQLPDTPEKLRPTSAGSLSPPAATNKKPRK